MMLSAFRTAVVLSLLCLSAAAQADVFNMGPALVSLETVLVGDPGNAADANGRGRVDNAYRIGKYEVTTAQYCYFLNHNAKTDPYGLYNAGMSNPVTGCHIYRSGSDEHYVYTVDPAWANKPVNSVSFWSACRFVNWLHNGQADEQTETGAYNLNEFNGSGGLGITRQQGAKWFIPSENEWYKSAYYKGGGTNEGYWLYPTQSNDDPGTMVINPDPGNRANCWGNNNGTPYLMTNVGEFENSSGPYRTFDQAGNVAEWTEQARLNGDRCLRGGAWNNNSDAARSSNFFYYSPEQTGMDTGFRVAAPIPEPSSIMSLTIGLGAIFGLRRRQTR